MAYPHNKYSPLLMLGAKQSEKGFENKNENT